MFEFIRTYAGVIVGLGFVCFALIIFFIIAFEPAPRRRFPRTSNTGKDYLHRVNSDDTTEEVK